MSRNATFWLAALAALLALAAVVLRLRHGLHGDAFGFIGPLGIVLLMGVIMARNLPGKDDRNG